MANVGRWWWSSACSLSIVACYVLMIFAFCVILWCQGMLCRVETNSATHKRCCVLPTMCCSALCRTCWIAVAKSLHSIELACHQCCCQSSAVTLEH